VQRIRMKTLSSTPDRTLQPDQVALLHEDEALELIVKGFAVPVDSRGNDVLIPAEDLAALRAELHDGLSIFIDDSDDEDTGDGKGDDPAGDGEDDGEPAAGGDEPAGQQEPATTEAEESGEPEAEAVEAVEDEAEAKARRSRRSRRT
jgi:hypothetical protein